MRDWHFVSEPARTKSASSVLPTATAQQPNYNAASQGRRLRMWRAPASGPNTSIVGDLPIIRGRTRAAARNDPWFGAGQEKSVANGIGWGISGKMVNGTDLEKAVAKTLWRKWSTECDADGVLIFDAIQALAWMEWDEAGEVFTRRRSRRPSDGLSVPMQVQVIEAEQCPADLNTVASNGNRVRAGIEFNAINKRVGYWFYKTHPGDGSFFQDSSEMIRVPADQIIHLYRPMRAGQIRGIPDAASTLVRMFNLESMDDAVLERQRIANLFAVFFEQTVDPEVDPNAMIDDLTDEGAETDVDDVPIGGLEPGTATELPPGYKATFSSPPLPGTAYAEYIRGHLLACAARRGVPYEVLTGDLRNVSDRALKLILNEFRRVLEMKQWLYFIPNWCQRIRNWWFDDAWLSGAMEFSDFQERREALIETLWVPQGWPYSHPVQDVTADIRAIRAGLDTRTDANLRRGEDPEEIDRKIAEDNKRSDELGNVYDSDPRKVSNAGLTQARAPGSELPSLDIDDEPTPQQPAREEDGGEDEEEDQDGQ